LGANTESYDSPTTLVRNLLTAKTKIITTVPTSNKQYQPQVEVLWATVYYTVTVRVMRYTTSNSKI